MEIGRKDSRYTSAGYVTNAIVCYPIALDGSCDNIHLSADGPIVEDDPNVRILRKCERLVLAVAERPDYYGSLSSRAIRDLFFAE
jgi:hypothetical protein